MLPALLVTHAVSAGALATPAISDRQSTQWGTLGNDAALTITTSNNASCQSGGDGSVDLHWGSMRPTYDATQSYTLSRRLRPTERLDWSHGAPDPPGANKARSDGIAPGCEVYSQTTNPDSNGNVLSENMCYAMNPAAVLDEASSSEESMMARQVVEEIEVSESSSWAWVTT